MVSVSDFRTAVGHVQVSVLVYMCICMIFAYASVDAVRCESRPPMHLHEQACPAAAAPCGAYIFIKTSAYGTVWVEAKMYGAQKKAGVCSQQQI